ncbi:MAG: hypothetical protein M1832_005404 [Thelocarpon impressellum]|nr:MAG: hypothetical protein M1832_005404 [Thelocarpon impressellum]
MPELLDFILGHEGPFRKARLPSLYSDFRHLQTTNPDGYAANVSAWRTALAHAAREGRVPGPGGSNDLLCLSTGEELVRELESKEWGRPLALGTVVNEWVARRDMVPFDAYLASPQSIYHSSWTVTPWQVFSWGLRQLGLGGGSWKEDKLAVGRFVVLENVEACAKNVTRAIAGRARVDRIFSREMFEADFSRSLGGSSKLTDADFSILLTHLARDKGEIAYDGRTIRFRSAGEAKTAITVQDTTIASLKTLIAGHEAQVSTLTHRIDALSTTARTAVGKKSRASALSALRSRKLAEGALAIRSDSLVQLERVLDSIRAASDQVEMVRVMEASTGVLRALQRDVGGVERVEDVVEELREQMGRMDEVGSAIAEAGQPQGVGGEEVDAELAALERDAEREREAETAAVLARADRPAEAAPETTVQKEPDTVVGEEGAGEATRAAAALGRMSLDETPRGGAREAEEQRRADEAAALEAG